MTRDSITRWTDHLARATRPAPLAEPDTGDAQPATQRCWKELGRSDTQAHLVAVCAKPEGHEGECSNVLPKPGGSR